MSAGEAGQVGDEEQIIEKLNRARFLALSEPKLAIKCRMCLLFDWPFLGRGVMRCISVVFVRVVGMRML